MNTKKVSLNWKKEFIHYLLIFFLGGTFQELFLERGILDILSVRWSEILMNGFFWLFLWKGSEYLVLMIDRTGIGWVEQPTKRFVISLVATLTYVVIVVFCILFCFLVVFGDHASNEFINDLSWRWFLSAIIVTLIISIFLHGRAFLIEWRQTIIKAERFERESLKSKYESLKNQVNPHFLFNSLNALSSLVYDDQEKAVEFIRKLAQVYRYVLDKKDMELVSLNDELTFLKNYIFLQKIRFGENLRLELDVKSEEGMVPPIALQTLVENAIKHNVVSEKKPLTISIEVGKEICVVRNNIQEKLEKDSTGIGLSNLRSRYDFLSDRQIEIENSNNEFIVKVPILNLSQ